MAKLTGPLMSLEARGSLGPGLTYSERESGSQVRIQQKQVIPKPSFASTDNQSLYRLIIARWNSFTQNQQDVYNEEVKTENLQISGWNLFVKKAMLNPLVYLGLAGYWTFNREGSGTVLDISKNGNHGTLEPNYPAVAPKYVESKNSRMRKALSFNGVHNYVSVPHSVSLDAYPITIGTWVKKDITNTSGGIIQKYLSGIFDGYMIFIATSRVKAWYWKDSSNHVRMDAAATDGGVIDSNWHYITFVVDSSGGKIFIDGVLKNTKAWTGSPAGPTTITPLEFGRYDAYLNALIDEVCIYNRALSAGEIKDIYNMISKK